MDKLKSRITRLRTNANKVLSIEGVAIISLCDDMVDMIESMSEEKKKFQQEVDKFNSPDNAVDYAKRLFKYLDTNLHTHIEMTKMCRDAGIELSKVASLQTDGLMYRISGPCGNLK
jgi:hypothetical protein